MLVRDVMSTRLAWIGDEAVDGSVEAVERLRAGGKRVAFATNNSRRSGEDYVRKLWGLGIQASLADVVTVGTWALGRTSK